MRVPPRCGAAVVRATYDGGIRKLLVPIFQWKLHKALEEGN